MTIFSDQDIQLGRERATRNLALEKPTFLQENFGITWDEFKNNDEYGSLREQRRNAWDERIKAIKDLGGPELDTPWNRFGQDNFFGHALFNPVKDIHFDPDHFEQHPEQYDAIDRNVLPHMPESLGGLVGRMFDGVDNDLTEPQRLRKHEDAIDRFRETLPEDKRHLVPTRDEIEAKLKERAKRLEAQSADIGARATGWGVVGRFLGAGGAAITQPEVLVTLPIGAPVRAGLLSKVLIEAGIGTAAEGALQPGVQSQRAELGLEHGLGPALENMAMAGGGAAGLTIVGGALRVIAKGGVSAFEKIVGRKATAEEKVLVDDFVKDAEAEQNSPYENQTPEAQDIQRQNEQLAYEAALDGRTLGDDEIVKDDELIARAMTDDTDSVTTLRNDDLGDIGVDARLMQFKAGGDDLGVTDRLRGVSEWVPERAGVSLVYEYADGSRIIADGHQRLGLANRLKAQGHKIEMPAIIFREADGISPAEARARAAFKNIAEGTGTAKDAAKVMRDMGATADDMGLPPRSSLVRDAEGLRKVDDETFGMVVNDVLSEQFGALIGRLVDDPRLQPEIARLLVKLKPANVAEADSIVRQAKNAGVSRETQSSLFGDEEITKSLYLEKARVLDRGMKMIRRNIDTFKTLNERGNDITAEGNILNEVSNAERLDMERSLKAYLQKQAHTKGVISDALTKAAQQAQETRQYAEAARQFVKAISRGIDEGKINGDAISRDGAAEGLERARQETPTEQAGDFKQVDDQTIQMFDEPVTKTSDEQAMRIHRELLTPEQAGDGLDQPIPMGEKVDAEGNRVAETQTVKEVLDDLEEDQEFFEQLKLCDGGGKQ